MRSGGGVNSIHKAIRGVGVAAGRSVSSANYHLVSNWVPSAAHLNLPVTYIFVCQRHISEWKSQVKSMRANFHMADAVLHFHHKLIGLKHPDLSRLIHAIHSSITPFESLHQISEIFKLMPYCAQRNEAGVTHSSPNITHILFLMLFLELLALEIQQKHFSPKFRKKKTTGLNYRKKRSLKLC